MRDARERMRDARERLRDMNSRLLDSMALQVSTTTSWPGPCT